MTRVAIIGSCITRDLWPILGETPRDLLYVSRTSLPSLFSPPLDVRTRPDPPAGLGRHQHNAVVADLRKLALQALIDHRPSHIIFDFIDERFDLLAGAGAVATHSWELEVSGYLAQPAFAGTRAVPRLSEACEGLWRAAVLEMAAFLAATPLRSACLILHSARWADRFVDEGGRRRPLDDDTWIWEGRPARRSQHNALLARYEAAFAEAVRPLHTVRARDRWLLADAGHRWGLSPFHYVEDYYRDVWRQLRALGI